jgi:DNA-binding Lrp family transcriptional regulator
MAIAATVPRLRRPRFRRASEPPAFRLTDDDIEIVRLLARHRFLRSTHIAALVGRSLDAVNRRLNGLFHHGYIDRPRAQLDYYPTAGSAPIAYALADRGARLLIDRHGINFGKVEWSRNNHRAGRPYIEHQLEIVDFCVAVESATRNRADTRLNYPDVMALSFPHHAFTERDPFALRVRVKHHGVVREIGLVPDLVFGLTLPDRSRRRSTAALCRWCGAIFCRRASSERCVPISPRTAPNSTSIISAGTHFACLW